MKTKRLYQAPLTERVLVELEGGFCASVVNDMGAGVEVTSSTQDYESFDAVSDGAFDLNNDNNAIVWK